jgi:RNA ligase (TIGR02306 family)
MSTIQRKLVTIRTIDAINPIPDADAIEVATLGGWNVVVKKNEFKAGDKVVYFEIDSFLPDGNPAWQFLVNKSSRTFEGVVGHRLRTVKLRGQVSQGLILPILAFAGREVILDEHEYDFADVTWNDGEDVTDLLGIKKWEQPLPAELAGQAEGLFPSFIRRTDQERCQNLVREIFQYEDQKVLVEGLDPQVVLDGKVSGMPVVIEDGQVFAIRRGKADRDARYEVTMKMDGSSMTVFARAQFTEPLIDELGVRQNPIETGVCSRNLQLKVNEANADNTFIKLAMQSGLMGVLEELADGGRDLAVQGELMGPGIQGNREQFKDFKMFIFDVQDIGTQTYLTPAERMDLMTELYSRGVNPNMVQHAPILHHSTTLDELGITNVKELLAFAEGPSLHHAVREGLVFKRVDGGFSFKAISNAYLAKEKD